MTSTLATSAVHLTRSSTGVFGETWYNKVVSLLSMEDIARLSVVSKSCRQLCISMPSLPFNVTPYRDNPTKRAKLMNFIESLLLLRKETDTQDCYIRWCLESSLVYDEEESRVFSWLSNVLKCKVKRLALHVTFKRGLDFALPSTMLHCKSLEAVTLIFTSGTGILKIPASVGGAYGFSSLRCLKMRSVRVDECFGKWVSSYCKSLMEVFLINISGVKNMIITSSSLKVLYIDYAVDLEHLNVSAKELVQLHLALEPANNINLKLSAPNLKLFVFIVESKLELQPFFDKNLVPVLRTVAGSLERLGLDEDSILELLKLRPPILLKRLDILSILIREASDDLVPILTSFLARTQNLRELIIQLPSLTNANRGGDNRTIGRWESQDVSVLKNLKFVTLEVTSQGENELELIRYFLKSAEDLQQMTVHYDRPLRTTFRKKIGQYKKASSNAELEFCQTESDLFERWYLSSF